MNPSEVPCQLDLFSRPCEFLGAECDAPGQLRRCGHITCDAHTDLADDCLICSGNEEEGS